MNTNTRSLRQVSLRVVQFWKDRISSRVSPLISVIWIIGFAAAGISLWGFSELASDVASQETTALDQSILLAIQTLHTPFLNQLIIGVTFLGEPLVLGVVGGIFGLVLLIRNRWANALVLAIAASGAMVLNTALKDQFARARPELWERIVDVSYYSFPSGHAMISLVVYGFIAYWLMTQFPAWRTIIGAIAIVLIAAIGFSRLYLGVHWPTDVIAGYSAGLVWLLTCILSYEVIRKIR